MCASYAAKIVCPTYYQVVATRSCQPGLYDPNDQGSCNATVCVRVFVCVSVSVGARSSSPQLRPFFPLRRTRMFFMKNVLYQFHTDVPLVPRTFPSWSLLLFPIRPSMRITPRVRDATTQLPD